MTAFVFPGYGSQETGMGESVFALFPDKVAQAEALLGFSVTDFCLDGAQQERLDSIAFAVPALYVVNELAFQRAVAEGREADVLIGHGFGEYNALCAAGAFEFFAGLAMVQVLASLLAKESGGAIASVVGLTAEATEAVIEKAGYSTVSVASIDGPCHLSVAGMRSEIVAARNAFEDAGALLVVVHPATAALFSPHLKAVQHAFSSYLTHQTFAPLSRKVIAGAGAGYYTDSAVSHNLADQITSSIRWQDCIRRAVRDGCDWFHEIGHGRRLTGLIEKIAGDCPPATCNGIRVAVKRASDGDDASVAGGNDQLQAALQSVIPATALGSAEFRQAYNVRYAYVAGAMSHGISTPQMICKLANAGFLSYLGTTGVSVEDVERSITRTMAENNASTSFGVNVTGSSCSAAREDALFALLQRLGVRHVSISEYFRLSHALVWYRYSGATRNASGQPAPCNRLLAKVSRTDTARLFMTPAPASIIVELVAHGKLTEEEAELAAAMPIADDVCVIADGAGSGNALALLPAILCLRDTVASLTETSAKICVGIGGGLGSPHASAAGFTIGADFVLTGSINQCTPEAGTSDTVKDILQSICVDDTAYAPSRDQFAIGGREEVLKKGILLPARAARLRQWYRQYKSLFAVPDDIRHVLEGKYFKQNLDAVLQGLQQAEEASTLHRSNSDGDRDASGEMAMLYKAYLDQGMHLALGGVPDRQVDYLVYCGAALGAFNEWVRGSELEDWRNRHVDTIATRMMNETAQIMMRRIRVLSTTDHG